MRRLSGWLERRRDERCTSFNEELDGDRVREPAGRERRDAHGRVVEAAGGPDDLPRLIHAEDQRDLVVAVANRFPLEVELVDDGRKQEEEISDQRLPEDVLNGPRRVREVRSGGAGRERGEVVSLIEVDAVHAQHFVERIHGTG